MTQNNNSWRKTYFTLLAGQAISFISSGILGNVKEVMEIRLRSKLKSVLIGNRQISRRIKKHLWLSNRSWARDVHSFGILHSWGALAGKSCSAQASSIWLIAGAFRRTQSK